MLSQWNAHWYSKSTSTEEDDVSVEKFTSSYNGVQMIGWVPVGKFLNMSFFLFIFVFIPYTTWTKHDGYFICVILSFKP